MLCILTGGAGAVPNSGGHCEHLKSRKAHREEGALNTHGGFCCLGSSVDILAKAALFSTFVLGSHWTTLALSSSCEIVSKLEGLVFTIP